MCCAEGYDEERYDIQSERRAYKEGHAENQIELTSETECGSDRLELAATSISAFYVRKK
jgi:hypothetical protein